jgi:hypothetical protein
VIRCLNHVSVVIVLGFKLLFRPRHTTAGVGFQSAFDYVVKPDIIIDTHRSQIIRRRESDIFAILDDKTCVTPLNVINRKVVTYVLDFKRKNSARGDIK